MKAIAYCGLACCVCSENDKCIGCQMVVVIFTVGVKIITAAERKA